MADDSAKVDDASDGPVDAAHIVRTAARQVEDAGDRLGDWIEGGANISQVEIGPTLDALSALAAAGPLLRLGAAGHESTVIAVNDVIRDQDALRARAVREVADAMAGDLADVLGRPADEPVPPWNVLLRVVRAMVVEDAQIKPAPTLSTRMALEALGYDATVAGGTWSPATIIDAIRDTVHQRNQAIDAAAAERARVNLWAGQLAALLLGDNPVEDWGTPLGLDQLMTAVRQAVATLSTDVLDVATAIGYRNPDASGGQLPTRADWPAMMRDLTTLRDQPAEQADELAAALGQADAGELGASFDDMLDAVRALVEQQAENANQVGATPAGPPSPAETGPREDWSAFSENLFEQRPQRAEMYADHPADDDGHGPDGRS